MSTPEQDVHIRRWFRLLFIRVRKYFADEVTRLEPRKNNHSYCAGLAVPTERLVDNNPQAFGRGANAYTMGAEAIQPDGSLPNEMARAGRALHYHLRHLALIILAELLEANGTRAYEADGGAIKHLVGFAVECLDDPGILEKQTGVHRVVSLPYSGQEIGWAVPYVHRFPDSPYTAQLYVLLARAPWVSFWQWGGMPPP